MLCQVFARGGVDFDEMTASQPFCLGNLDRSLSLEKKAISHYLKKPD